MTYEEMIDVEAVKERFMGNYELFSMYLYQFAQGELFNKLDKALNGENVKEAFDIAHDMKGVILNLSLSPLENQMAFIVETLRKGRLLDKTVWDTFQSTYILVVKQIEKMKKEEIVLF